MGTEPTADLSSEHFLSGFFKKHIFGMAIFAVATGVVSSFIYDRIKNSPTPTGAPEVASPLPASPPLISAPSDAIIRSNPASTPDSLESERLATVKPRNDVTTEERSALYESKRADADRTFQRDREAANRLKEQQDAEALVTLQRDQGAANDARGLAQANARAKQEQAMRDSSALIHSRQFADGNALKNSAGVAYGKDLSEIELNYSSAINDAKSRFKQTIADNKERYEAAVLASETKHQAILSELKH